MIKAIIFDYFGVISSVEYWDFVASHEGDDDIYNDLSDKVNQGKINWGKFCESVCIAKGVDREQLNAMFKKQRINRQLIGYIAKLKANYKVGMLTNANRTYIDGVFNTLHIGDLFDGVVVSSDIGILKPQLGAYKAILNELGVEPEETIMIDDSGVNTDGAKAVGMQAVLFEDFESMLAECNDLLKE